jgi:hypothetical protein
VNKTLLANAIVERQAMLLKEPWHFAAGMARQEQKYLH